MLQHFMKDLSEKLLGKIVFLSSFSMWTIIQFPFFILVYYFIAFHGSNKFNNNIFHFISVFGYTYSIVLCIVYVYSLLSAIKSHKGT